MGGDFEGHPLFIAGVAHAHLLVRITGCIPGITRAPVAHQGATLAAVVLAFEDGELGTADAAILTAFIWIPCYSMCLCTPCRRC